MKKSSLLFLSFLFCIFNAIAQDSRPGVSLIAIIDAPGYRVATLAISNAASARADTVTLNEGERQGPLEVITINSKAGTARVKFNQATLDVGFPVRTNSYPNLVLNKTDLKTAFRHYAETAHRTVLRGPLPNLSITLETIVKDEASIASVFTNAFLANGILTVLDGDKFSIMVLKTSNNRVTPHSADIKPSERAPLSAKTGKNILPPGTIDFPQVDFPMILPFYGELIGAGYRGVEHNEVYSHLKDIPISLTTQTSLSKQEAIYALDTIFALNGIKVAVSTNGLLKVTALDDH